MATPGATIGKRIEDLIGSVYTTTATESSVDLINAAFNEIVDMLPVDLLLKYSNSPTVVSSASGVSIEDKKILKVTRIDSNGGVERECKILSRDRFSQATDDKSMHYSTVYSPIYKIHSDNTASTLVIFPNCNGSGQEGKIWYFSYATNSTNLTEIDSAELNTVHFLPGTLINAIVLKASLNILYAYVSNQVQDEEDVELLSMIQNQMQLIEKSFLTEMQRFTTTVDKPKGE